MISMFRVDHWALIDFDGLAKLIDTLGGIEVNVSCPLSDTIDEQAFTIPAGRVQMDYLTAKRYVQLGISPVIRCAQLS